MQGSDLALAAILAGGASEATGVTNLTPLGPSDSDEKPELPPSLRVPGGGSGGGSDFDLDLPDITLPSPAQPQQVPTLPDLTPDLPNQDDGPTYTPPWDRDDGPSIPGWPPDIPELPDRDGNGGGGDGGGGSDGTGPLTDPEPGIQLGDIPFLAGETKDAAINTGQGAGDFMAENPYVTAGTTIGAISPDPITTAAGAGVGALAELTSDTLTGGTPLGVDSPIDVTGDGAWWKGPDPLGLSDGKSKSPGSRGPSDSGGSGGDGGSTSSTSSTSSDESTAKDETGNKPFGGLPVSDGSPIDRLRKATPGGPNSGEGDNKLESGPSSDPASKTGPGTISESIDKARESVKKSTAPEPDQPARGRGKTDESTAKDKSGGPLSNLIGGGITGDRDTSIFG